MGRNQRERECLWSRAGSGIVFPVGWDAIGKHHSWDRQGIIYPFVRPPQLSGGEGTVRAENGRRETRAAVLLY